MQQALIEYLINAAWQVPLVAVGAMIVARVGGLGPRARNLVWLAFLGVAVLSPALPFALASHGHGEAVVNRIAAVAPGDADIVALAPTSDNLDRARPSRFWRIDLDWRSASLIKLAFVTAAAVALARLALAGMAARRLVRDAVEVALPPPVTDALAVFAQAHGCQIPPIRESARLCSPAVVGAIRPVILTPAGFSRHTEDEQRAALLHEFAHVLRRDYAVNLLCELIALPVSWHPALYEIKAGVRRSREAACDALASSAMASREAYARCLLSLAKSLGAGATRDQSAALVGLFGKSDLEERLMHLLTRKTVEGRGLRTARLFGTGMIAAGLIAPVTLFRVTPAFAQAESIAAAPAVPAAPSLPAAPAAPAAPPAPPTPPAPPAAVHLHHAARSGERTHNLYIRRWTTPDGKTHAVTTDDDYSVLTEDGQRRLHETVERALEKSAAVEKQIQSPEFKQRIADLVARQKELVDIDSVKMNKQIADAVKQLNDARVQEALARAQIEISANAMRESREAVAKMRRELEESLRDPEPSK